MSADYTDRVGTLEAAVAQVPGVARLYPAGALLGTVASTIVAAISGADPADEIAVDDAQVSIRIGVDAERSAAQVCRDVYTAARSWAQESGRDGLTIRVTVVGLDDRS